MGAKLSAFVSLGLLGVAAVGAPPLSAHEDHLDFEWLEPDSDSDVSGHAARIRARAAFPEGVDRWTLEVVAPAGSKVSTKDGYGFVCQGGGGYAETGDKALDIDCTWDTTTYPQGSIAPNQDQALRLTAWEKGTGDATPEPHVAPLREVVVANPPVPPSGLSLAHSESSPDVALAWEPNPEPDVANYVVEQRFDDGAWEAVAAPGSPSWQGRLSRPGTYEYRVAATRPVGSRRRTLKSRFATPEPASVTLEAVAEGSSDEPISPSGAEATSPPAALSPSPPSAAEPASPAVSGQSSGAGAPAGPPGGQDVRYQLAPHLQERLTSSPSRRAPEPDSGFSERLPYGTPESAAPGIAPGEGVGQSAQVAPAQGPASSSPNPLVFPAGALVAFVAAMLGFHIIRRPAAVLRTPGDWD